MPQINVRSWSIGPKHDPYEAHLVQVIGDNGEHGTYYSDALGQHRVEFYSKGNPVPTRRLEWHCADFVWGKQARRSLQMSLKCNLLAKRSFGMRFDEAESAYWQACSSI